MFYSAALNGCALSAMFTLGPFAPRKTLKCWSVPREGLWRRVMMKAMESRSGKECLMELRSFNLEKTLKGDLLTLHNCLKEVKQGGCWSILSSKK